MLEFNHFAQLCGGTEEGGQCRVPSLRFAKGGRVFSSPAVKITRQMEREDALPSCSCWEDLQPPCVFSANCTTTKNKSREG